MVILHPGWRRGEETLILFFDVEYSHSITL